MGLLITLIIGGVIGWLAARALGREEGIVASVIIGIIGAFIGGWLSSLFGSSSQSFVGLSLAGIIWSFIGAIILVAILNAFQHRSSRVH